MSREIGVYGNREGSEREGKVILFERTTRGDGIIQSIIEDLIGLKEGDFVFFHVLKKSEESSVHGIYRCSKEPFYDESKIWESAPSPLVYPYRFRFEPHPDHIELCKYDASIPVSEFYRAIENRAIRSIFTLEREVRGAAHAVKTITRDDAKEIMKLLYRGFLVRHTKAPVSFRPIQMQMKPLRGFIRRIGEIEFAIKALAAFKLGNKDSSFTEHIPACEDSDYDFLIETFVGQTMRRPLDLLCIANKMPKIVTTIEAKTDQAQTDDLIQALKYQEVFKLRNIDRGSLDYKYSICLLAKRFDQELVEYSAIRNMILPREEIRLLKYLPTQDGKDAAFSSEVLKEMLVAPLLRSYPKIKVSDPLSQITADAEEYYRIFQEGKPSSGITVRLRSKDRDRIVLERIYEHGTKEASVGQILIHQIPRKCSLEDFREFMHSLYDEANKAQGDFMNTKPLIIAQEYEDLVGLFIEKYNKYETSAQRQPISAYVI